MVPVPILRMKVWICLLSQKQPHVQQYWFID